MTTSTSKEICWEQASLELKSTSYLVLCNEAALKRARRHCARPFHQELQDVLELSDDQRVALVAARRKLLSTAEEINLQRQQVCACRVWKPVPCVSRSRQLLACMRSPKLFSWRFAAEARCQSSPVLCTAEAALCLDCRLCKTCRGRRKDLRCLLEHGHRHRRCHCRWHATDAVACCLPASLLGTSSL